MRQADMVALARAAATQHGLDDALVCAVVEQESTWNEFAIRYEPAFFTHYVAPLYTANKINATEAYARSFSWGLMQVMGEVAREYGYAGSLAGLCDPVAGLDIGCKVLSHKISDAHGEVQAGLLRWNGGGNPDYPAQVLARKSRYEVQPADLSMEGDV